MVSYTPPLTGAKRPRGDLEFVRNFMEGNFRFPKNVRFSPGMDMPRGFDPHLTPSVYNEAGSLQPRERIRGGTEEYEVRAAPSIENRIVPYAAYPPKVEYEVRAAPPRNKRVPLGRGNL